jgi:amino acid transporter
MPSESKSFLGRVFRRVEQLFHILIGVVFLFLTMGMVTVSMKLWQEYQKTPGQGTLNLAIVVASIAFTFLLFIFCLYTFVKARSVR